MKNDLPNKMISRIFYTVEPKAKNLQIKIREINLHFDLHELITRIFSWRKKNPAIFTMHNLEK